jgi:hypothetical protein
MVTRQRIVISSSYNCTALSFLVNPAQYLRSQVSNQPYPTRQSTRLCYSVAHPSLLSTCLQAVGPGSERATAPPGPSQVNSMTEWRAPAKRCCSASMDEHPLPPTFPHASPTGETLVRYPPETLVVILFLLETCSLCDGGRTLLLLWRNVLLLRAGSMILGCNEARLQVFGKTYCPDADNGPSVRWRDSCRS